MNDEAKRQRTRVFLVIFMAVWILGGGLTLLAWELTGIGPNASHSIITPVVQEWWATYPWAITLVLLFVTSLGSFFTAHFIAQNRPEYDAARKRIERGGGE